MLTRLILSLMVTLPMFSSGIHAEASAPVQVYAHRGASAHFPEHTLAAYARAIADGADAIEPDLVPTRDGHLVARHENEIGATTDVAMHPEFAARRKVREIDGQRVEGWFTEDFTVAELKRLRARERLPQLRGTRWDGQFQIVTLDEIVDFTAAMAASAGRSIGLVPELKHPAYFRNRGLAVEERLLERPAGARVHAQRAGGDPVVRAGQPALPAHQAAAREERGVAATLGKR